MSTCAALNKNLCFPLPDQGTQQLFVDSLAFARKVTLVKRTEAATLRQTAWAAFESALFTDREATA